MSVNNFEQIKKLLTFNSEDEFYFVQILQRKKDNPGNIHGSNNSSRLIKAYYIKSIEELERQQEEMIHFANYFNARVGINLNKRSFYKTAFNTMKNIAEQMHNKNFKSVHRAWNTACGIHNDIEDKIWILDVDKLPEQNLVDLLGVPISGLEIEESREYHVRKFINESQPISLLDKVIAKIASKSGYHLITTGFDTRGFSIACPNIEIHKNNPTNLWIP